MFVIKAYRFILARLIASLTKAADLKAKEALWAKNTAETMKKAEAGFREDEAKLRAEAAKFQGLVG